MRSRLVINLAAGHHRVPRQQNHRQHHHDVAPLSSVSPPEVRVDQHKSYLLTE